MNREIKFRGKRYNGMWVYGDLCMPANRFVSIRENKYNYNGVAHEEYEVIEDTVGQFTGLKDKHGNDIYEGDILHVVEYKNKATMIFKDGEIQELELSLDEVRGEIVSEWHGTVECDESCMIVGNRYLDALFGDMRYSQPIFEFEVVGNIHDDHLLIDE